MANESEQMTQHQKEDLKLKQEDLDLKRKDFWRNVGVLVVGAISAWVAYHSWMSQREQFQKKELDLREKENEQRAKEQEQRSKEYKLKFYERQMQTYFDLSDLATKIALAKRLKDVAREINDYQALLWGRLSIVSDNKVAISLNPFNEILSKLRPDEEIPSELLPLAHKITSACRESLRETFPDVVVLQSDPFGDRAHEEVNKMLRQSLESIKPGYRGANP